MAKFMKRPVTIDALVYDGSPASYDQISKEFGETNLFRSLGVVYCHTLEGDLTVSPGDYIVKGVKNECWPVKPDVFEATYVPVISGNFRPRTGRMQFGADWQGVFLRGDEVMRVILLLSACLENHDLSAHLRLGLQDTLDFLLPDEVQHMLDYAVCRRPD